MLPEVEPIKDNENKKHARLPAQMPASRVSKNPGGNNRQERMDAVSGREDREQTTRGQDNKKRRANLERNPEHVAQQRGGPSGQHLADFATLPSAVVKVPRAYRYGHLAIVCTIEKVLPRGKNSENLDCLVQKLARTWWQRCHTSTFGNPERVKCITESMTARIVDFNR